jgi:hypothetical protein
MTPFIKEINTVWTTINLRSQNNCQVRKSKNFFNAFFFFQENFLKYKIYFFSWKTQVQVYLLKMTLVQKKITHLLRATGWPKIKPKQFNSLFSKTFLKEKLLDDLKFSLLTMLVSIYTYYYIYYLKYS